MEKSYLFDEKRQSITKTHNREDKIIISEYHFFVNI